MHRDPPSYDIEILRAEYGPDEQMMTEEEACNHRSYGSEAREDGGQVRKHNPCLPGRLCTCFEYLGGRSARAGSVLHAQLQHTLTRPPYRACPVADECE